MKTKTKKGGMFIGIKNIFNPTNYAKILYYRMKDIRLITLQPALMVGLGKFIKSFTK